jgi:D-serine deaminase-like pyridoxal phosphate-dependent protein
MASTFHPSNSERHAMQETSLMRLVQESPKICWPIRRATMLEAVAALFCAPTKPLFVLVNLGSPRLC